MEDLKLKLENYMKEYKNKGPIKQIKSDVYNFVYNDIVRYYPNNETKNVYDVVDISFDIGDFKNTVLCVIKKDGTKQSISYKDCIKNRFGKTVKKSNNLNNKLSKAMRNAISDEIINFKNGAVLKCTECGTKDANMDVDHIIDFVKLSSDFIKQKNIPIEFDEKIGGQYYFKKCNEDFENDWKNYHKNQVNNLRILCHNCNIRRNRQNTEEQFNFYGNDIYEHKKLFENELGAYYFGSSKEIIGKLKYVKIIEFLNKHNIKYEIDEIDGNRFKLI